MTCSSVVELLDFPGPQLAPHLGAVVPSLLAMA